MVIKNESVASHEGATRRGLPILLEMHRADIGQRRMQSSPSPGMSAVLRLAGLRSRKNAFVTDSIGQNKSVPP